MKAFFFLPDHQPVFVPQAGIMGQGRLKNRAVLLPMETHRWSCNSRFLMLPAEAGRISFRQDKSKYDKAWSTKATCCVFTAF